MKSFILAIALVFGVTAVYAEAETKKVCNITKDKSGKQKEICKTIKIHKKLDGTKVSSAKKTK